MIKDIFSLKLFVKLRALSKNLSIRAAAFALLALFSTFLAITLSPLIPQELSDILGGGAVKNIIEILANSMLVVVTFSMSTLVATYSMISSSATPRAVKIIMEDSSAHNALSTFLGAFIFSILSLISLSTDFYGPKQKVILFFVTIVVLIIVIVTIINWIGRLSRFGHLENLVFEIEKKIETSLELSNTLFSQEKFDKRFSSEIIFDRERYGYIQSIDLDKLETLCDENQIQVVLNVNVGDYIGKGSIFAYAAKLPSEGQRSKILSCFYIGKFRTFEEDPRYAITSISEISSKALSPGINDPGSAIFSVHSITRILFKIANKKVTLKRNIYFKPISIKELFDLAFLGTMRDGAEFREVRNALEESFEILEREELFTAIVKQIKGKGHK